MRDLDDTALERRLREVLEEHLRPLPLDLTVDALDRRREARGVDRRFGRGHGVTLLAAAALLLVGGALAAGSGILRQRTVVPPAPSFGQLAIVSPDVTTPSPSDLARPSSSPIAAAGPGGTWIRTGSMITPRYDNVAVRLADGRVLIAGGFAKEGESLTSAELYDPTTGTWSATGSMVRSMLQPALGFANFGTLLLDGRVLVSDKTGAELYDPATGTWSVTGKPAVAGGSATLLADGRVLLTGSTSQLYDPASGTWSATGRMVNQWFQTPAAVRLHDGRVLATGLDVGGDLPTKAAELYDPSTGTWSATGNKILGGGSVTALLLLPDGRVFYENELYDPATGSWKMAPGISDILPWANRVLLNDGKVLYMGFPGADPSWLYDPATGSRTETGSILADPAGSVAAESATVLLDGTVLAEGGWVCPASCPSGPDGAIAGAQLYIPAGVSPPTGLGPFPSPTPTPTPTPVPTPYPPTAGPVPQGARPWEVTVVNRSSKAAPLFLAREPLNDMGQLCGSVTPDIVPAGVTVKVTFQLPPKKVNDCWLMIRPGPGADGALGPTDNWPTPGKLIISDGGDNANGDDLSTVWQGP